MSTISIIVPAYNCEDTIRKCIESIINQSSTNWELIIVNDGSTDRTLNICKEYEDSEKIFLFTQPNSGVSNARNVGISHATGEYIVFVDSDDCLLDNALSIINDTMHDTDICFYNYQVEYQKSIEHMNYINNTDKISFEDFRKIFGELFTRGYINPPWAKCYKKNLIKEVFRVDLSIGEDLLFNFNYLKECKSITLLPHEIYSYHVSDSNSLSNNNRDKSEQLLKVYSDSTRICGYLFKDKKDYNCVTIKYVVDQLNEIEKKIRFKNKYSYNDMMHDIYFSKIDKLCCEKTTNIQNRKWKKAVNMVSSKSFLSLFLYLKAYSIPGKIIHDVTHQFT